jgi:hypothetical protein|tara:strand:+ start:1013 stop:1333 length:321 start_codon:yes stop_codon:yes gene_type:complete
MILSEKKLRQLIRTVLQESLPLYYFGDEAQSAAPSMSDITETEELLGEPDSSGEDDREENEQNVASNIAGYEVPLGMGSSAEREERRRRAEKANASAFGGAKPYKN